MDRADIHRLFSNTSRRSQHLLEHHEWDFAQPTAKDHDREEAFIPVKTSKPKLCKIRNDYSEYYARSGQRPQNHITDAHPMYRFLDYPKLAQLSKLKNELTDSYATPPMYLQLDILAGDLKAVFTNTRFDVVLIDLMGGGELDSLRSIDKWEILSRLPLSEIAAVPSFVFVCVGDGEGIDKGRDLLTRWGYRRCEDICWVKSNKEGRTIGCAIPPSIIVQTKEHCLMGIRGTVRRSTDGHFIHCNVDTDVIITEEPKSSNCRPPEELYQTIEHFCLGRRRLQLFGDSYNIRKGWVTVGKSIPSTNWDEAKFDGWLKGTGAPSKIPSGMLLPTTAEIDQLRPKSPRGALTGKGMRM